MQINTDIDLLVNTLIVEDDENIGRLVRFDMGILGADPRTVTARVIARQKIWNGSIKYRVEIIDDPKYPEYCNGVTLPLTDAFEWIAN